MNGPERQVLICGPNLFVDSGGRSYRRRIFQPAEEGLGGGRTMMEDGLFERFPCDEIYALHNMPLIPLGQASVRAGAALASFDLFDVTIHGQAEHAAMPHKTVDAGLVMAYIETIE